MDYEIFNNYLKLDRYFFKLLGVIHVPINYIILDLNAVRQMANASRYNFWEKTLYFLCDFMKYKDW